MSREERVLELPPDAAASDADLHAVATRIFHAALVRSVTVDRERAVAIVRMRSGAAADEAGQSADDAQRALLPDEFRKAAVTETQAVELVSWIDPRDGSISIIRVPDRVRGWRKAVYFALSPAALSLGR